MGSVPFHGQLLTFHGLVGDALESPLRFEGSGTKATVGSTERPTLGPKCVKFIFTNTSSNEPIVDGRALVKDKAELSGGFAFSSLTMNAPGTWGADDWTIGIQLFYLGLNNDPWSAMAISEDLCRAYALEYGQDRAHVFEARDITDGVVRCIDLSNAHDYWCTWIWRRSGACELRLYERGTGVLLGTKTWTGAALLPDYMTLGLVGFDTAASVPVPQTFFMTDFVLDTDNALFPILDYDPPSEPERKSNVVTKCTSASQVLRGPLSIQGFKWISQPGSLIVAGDRLVTNIGIEHYAEAGHLGCVERFKTPIVLREGEELIFSVLGHGAVFFFTT